MVIVGKCSSGLLSLIEPGVFLGDWGEQRGHAGEWVDALGEWPQEGAHPEAGPGFISSKVLCRHDWVVRFQNCGEQLRALSF